MTNILISPLGRSPGAVSGIYFSLCEKSCVIDKVVTVSTSNEDVLEAAQSYLRPIFMQKGVHFDPIHLPADDLRGGKQNVMPYVGMIGLAIKDAVQEAGSRENVHVAVTGGRSGMGALAALAAQLYGAGHLWHLWVPLEIEQNGMIVERQSLLPIDPNEMVRSHLLNPTVWGESAWDLVELPFLDLSPLDSILRTYVRTGKLPELDAPVSRLILSLGPKQLGQIFPEGMTVSLADEAMALAEEIRRANTNFEKQQAWRRLVSIISNAGMIDPGEQDNFVNLLMSNASLDEIIAYPKKKRGELWNLLKEHKGELGLALTATGVAVEIASFMVSTAYSNATLFLTGLELIFKITGLIVP